MTLTDIDLKVIHLTTDAIGQPGKRIFYLQGRSNEQTLTLLVEKLQIQTLAIGVEQFLTEIATKFPDLKPASVDYVEEKMRLYPPLDPLFRVGELGLGYDSENDTVVLVASEQMEDEQSSEETTQEGNELEERRVVRFWCTRSQIRAMAHWGLELSGRGRPICPQCGEPMEPEGHFCPKKNGHKH